MNGILIAAVLSLLYTFAGGFAVVPQINTPEKSFLSDNGYQNIHTILQAIETRLQNLEGTINRQFTTLVDGKLEYYGRKSENIEKDVTKFEAHVRIELDKLLEDVSNKNFKEDITKDRTIRKIDSIYERISHKLNSIEGQIDVSNIKTQNVRETVLSKLDKIEENLNIRDSDLEAEVAEAAAAIDDLKTTCTNIEENLVNLTKDSLKAIVKSGEKISKKHYIQATNLFEDASKNISAGMLQLQKTIDITTNQSIDTYTKINKAKTDLEESLNEYANKVTDMYSDLWEKTDKIEITLRNVATVTNTTRNEQQNSLRSLMVEVGRKTPKHSGINTTMDSQKLAELIKKIDSNFENVMSVQNMFLESCHRVQMDESQLESQISLVLEKLIDTFENKTVVGPKDIKHLEHLIRNHDTNIRKSIYHITSHLLNLIQKNSDNKDEIVEYIRKELLHLQALQMMVHEALNIKNSVLDNDILHELQVLHNTINKTQASLEKPYTSNFYVTELSNSSESKNRTDSSQLNDILEYVRNISITLNSLERKLNRSFLNAYTNNYRIDINSHQFQKHLKSLTGNESSDINQNFNYEFDKTTNYTKVLVDKFSRKSYNSPLNVNQNAEEVEGMKKNIPLTTTEITVMRHENNTTNSTEVLQNRISEHPQVVDKDNNSIPKTDAEIITTAPKQLIDNTIPPPQLDIDNDENGLFNKITPDNHTDSNHNNNIEQQSYSTHTNSNQNTPESVEPSRLKIDTNYKIEANNEETNTALYDIEQLFQTTEKDVYFQTEKQLITNFNNVSSGAE